MNRAEAASQPQKPEKSKSIEERSLDFDAQGLTCSIEMPAEEESGFEKQSKDDQVIFCMFEAIGLFSALVATSLIAITILSDYRNFGSWNDGAPVAFFVPALISLTFIVTRLLAKPLGTKRGRLLILCIAFLLGGIAPLGLLHPILWVAALLFTAIGYVAILFIWWSHLNVLGHKVLVTLTSLTLTLSATSVMLIGVLDLGSPINIAISCCLVILSCILTLFIRDKNIDGLMLIDSTESERHMNGPYSTHIAELFYLVVGMLIGVTLSFVFLFELLGPPSSQIPKITLIFSTAMLIAGVILLIFRYQFEYAFEKTFKDLLSFCCTLGLIFLPFVSTSLQVVCVVFLLMLTITHFMFIATACIERVRFEEISPLWYAGEFSFLFAGIAIGQFAAWLLSLNFFGTWSLILCCFISILVIIFFQIIFNKAGYPTFDLYENLRKEVGGRPDRELEFRGGRFWKRKVLHICSQYCLSPRQTEVLIQLAKGRDATYIANYFDISQSTAKTHLAHIYQKLDIHSRQDLLDLIDSIHLPAEHSAKNTDQTDSIHSS